jgi:hypothetical protein
LITLKGWEFAAQVHVASAGECYFYHTMDVPSGGGVVTHPGNWDLRGRYDDYIYGAHLKGKSVLDVGTASGWISFEAERHGSAEVVGLDMAHDLPPQFVPYAFSQLKQAGSTAGEHVLAHHKGNLDLRKAYWYCHERFGSKAKVVYGNAHTAGDHIFGADVVVLGQILVHQRYPLQVFHQCAKIANETLVIIEGCLEHDQPVMAFGGLNGNFHSWFHLSTKMYQCYLDILGFQVTSMRKSAYRCNHLAEGRCRGLDNRSK